MYRKEYFFRFNDFLCSYIFLKIYGRLKSAIFFHADFQMNKSNKSINKKQSIVKLFNFMAPFYGWVSTTSRVEPLGGGSLWQQPLYFC